MRLRAAALVTVLLAALGAAAPVHADQGPTRVADVCGDSSGPADDLASVSFGYSADSFQVTPSTCAPVPGPMGDWRVTLHLTSFSPEVQISGLMQDVGKYEYWHGMFFCAQASCPLVDAGDGSSRPAGRRLTDLGSGYYASSAVEARPRLTYGSWRENLPDGTAVPSSISWYAEISVGDAPAGTPFHIVDRVPESGTVTSTVLPPPRTTALTAYPGPALVAGKAALREDTGMLRHDSSSGEELPGRKVELVVGPGSTPPVRATVGVDVPSVLDAEPSGANGWWRDSYALSTPYQQLHGLAGNAVVRAYFPGDGVNAASYSAPYHAYVRAFVSLDLRDGASLPRNRPVDLRGVVRPRGSGSVEVLVKPDRPGYAWSLLRQTNLVDGQYDSYYREPWTPRTPGRYVLVTRWRHGTTDDGGVLNGLSDYRHVTVR